MKSNKFFFMKKHLLCNIHNNDNQNENIRLSLWGVDLTLSLCLDTKEATLQGEPSSCCLYPFLYYIQILIRPFPFLLPILLIHSLSFSLRGGKDLHVALHGIVSELGHPEKR